MPRSFRSRARPAGFSLIEVLVALALVGLVLAATARIFATGLLVQDALSGTDTALALAEDQLERAGIDEGLSPGSSEGVFAGRFSWRVTVAPYDDKATADLAEPGFRLYRIEAIVAWREGRRERRTALAALRLAPAPPP